MSQGMSQEPNAANAVEQVVSRALRDNLESVQRNSDEIHQAIADVAAEWTEPVVAHPIEDRGEHSVQQGVERVAEAVVEAPVVAEAVEAEHGPVAAGESEEVVSFNVTRLSAEEQELHRSANRVAKVSMQDIKMLRPEQVKLGREHKDICNRLRDEIEK